MKLSAIYLLPALLIVISRPIWASTVAVIDSGIDFQHPELVNHVWVDSREIPNNNRDEDGDGYQDDVSGWNFAEDNNKLIDYSYQNYLNDDIKEFFRIQGKIYTRDITPDEITWIKAKASDAEFIARLTTYGNYMHGTHVSAIASKNSSNQVMGIKLIPTEIKLPKANTNKGVSMFLAKLLLKTVAKQQAALMENIFAYVSAHNIAVANGSFGTGFPQAQMIAKLILDKLSAKDPTQEEIDELATFFIEQTLASNSVAIQQAPNTLFVFAAGNDGSNNDQFPASPTNLAINHDNVISVGATFADLEFANFSNFGNAVDVAAPGVNILSATPNNNYLQVSGTSQAAPYVANIATQIRAINPKLSPKEVKRIILETADVKAYLVGKVKTSGLVNPARSVTAAELSRNASLSEAIQVAKSYVINADDGIDKSAFEVDPMVDYDIQVMPLPAMFVVSE
ncbi:MAG: hypothetical protein A2504_12710 [Bdellovibrionales bacterium RIFOXYD12_FULL_39_22]|nr:MAG: hypothetical protein A2385_03795 [Bdellovibrionales bacterium RIFOXYB1_FULL_39_21]OFZ40475.1 MAG: hypothetical protein A2485_02660 [Bdellovibrionales bacterium RIFOXYC12_FULL_39_17]OFZ49958.1 MAG: hypothetical protein A2404_01995 [Bdellovibrionales bacterium RIFOXYC1_FULL_39_130]OFZ77600.1 MAG: hypothetical protein A2560_04555 [Bdellovibrionales bacterium RIFOXYD1_FULL_39_84]OFZ96054.1 MAG: hypothetical protein A2504_12710 [Bdellovibrionales bacterium RIFOXYD12_FULL_39_22]HLE10657.1 S8